MLNKQLKNNIKALDKEIGEITLKLAKAEKEEDVAKMTKRIDELTKIRTQLSNDLVNESYSKEIIAGAVSIASILLVLKYEEDNIITTKAFSMIPKMFRG